MTCSTKQELKNQVRDALSLLHDLARRELAAIMEDEQSLAVSNDRRLENAFGLKERCIGAYQQHVREHGC